MRGVVVLLGFLVLLLAIPFATAPTVSACTTITAAGTYTLDAQAGNVSDCFTIRANNTVLDCQGNFAYFGSGGSGYGIYIDTQDNITVQNCWVISNSTSLTSRAAIYGIRATNISVINNTVVYEGNDLGVGVQADNDCNDWTVENNTINMNGSDFNYGIRMEGQDHNITNNIVVTTGTADSNYGIEIDGSNHTYRNNNITTNGTTTNHGFNCFNDDVGGIYNNSVIAQGDTANNDGMRFSGCDNWEVLENRIETQGSTNNDGIDLQGVSTWNNFSENHIVGNGTSGDNTAIRIGAATVDQNWFTNNNLTVLVSRSLINDTSDGTSDNFLSYSNSFGSVTWVSNGTGNFSSDLDLNSSNELGLGLDRNLHISQNVVSLNTSAFVVGLINGSANISLTNIFLIAADRILKTEAHVTTGFGTGIDCTASGECTVISYDYGNTLRFNVTGFSGYKGSDNPTTVPEFSDYAIMLILVMVVGGFFAKKRKMI